MLGFLHHNDRHDVDFRRYVVPDARSSSTLGLMDGKILYWNRGTFQTLNRYRF